jgi:glycosyltransferase involved in cell wall biosynthesis
MKISVIIPVYNSEKFIRKAVESALSQAEVEEVILIEDASPDSALAICIELAQNNNKVKLFQHDGKKNLGAGASRNLGIIKAQCDYIAFLDSDDFYLPGRFNKEKEIFSSQTDVEGVYNAVNAFPLDFHGNRRFLSSNTLVTMNEAVNPDDLFDSMAPVGSKGLFSIDGLTVTRNVFDKVGLFDVNLRLSQDTEIFVRMSAICKLIAGELLKPVALYGLHVNNRSQFGDKIIANRPYMFYKLYTWSRQKRLGAKKIFILWQRFYEYYIIVEKPPRRKQRILLLREFFNNPWLIKSRFFRKQLPILSRIMS